MISPKSFFKVCKEKGISFFTGIPDSLLKDFCAYIDKNTDASSHVIASNEGTAVGLAVGHYLGSGKLPLIYLQNSGLGNVVNPILSLCDKEVYSIPIVLLIGWRGEPGTIDEPQHIKQGRVTPSILESMEIPFKLITKNENQSIINTEWAVETAKKLNCPVALLVQKDAFEKSVKNNLLNKKNIHFISRESAISIITENISKKSIIISTTGMISRELYEKRSKSKQDRSKDFLTVGSMGHASQIALGIAKANPDKKIVCLDGDGAALMHLGGMSTIGTSNSGNLLHIVLNNGAHDSVGGQPTVAQKISLTSIAKACCYRYIEGPIKDKDEIVNVINKFKNLSGMCFIEIYVDKGYRNDLGRPKESPIFNKEIFMKNIRN